MDVQRWAENCPETVLLWTLNGNSSKQKASPPKDCEIIQLCPPEKLKSKRDSKNIEVLKADYILGKKVAEDFLVNP